MRKAAATRRKSSWYAASPPDSLHAPQATSRTPKAIVILAGTNNVNRNSIEEIAEGVTAIVEECHRLCPKSQIILLAIFPRSPDAEAPWRKKLMEVNKLLAPLGGRDYVTYLDIGPIFLHADGTMNRDLMPDLLHPSRTGYEAWPDALRPTLSRYLDLPAAGQ